jgi:hypothetical protein
MKKSIAVSADKMMVKCRGPVWHKKQKDLGVIPKKLRGIDRDGTWGKSTADGWVYGHGTFMITPHDIPIAGMFKWMPNSGNEAKRMEVEVQKLKTIINIVCMDSKADDQHLHNNLKTTCNIQLITKPRKGMDKTASRKKFIKEMNRPKNKKIYLRRSTTVEPMQGLMKEIFGLETCWMRGNANNRWIIAAMGIAVQISQHQAVRRKRSTWAVKNDVNGI